MNLISIWVARYETHIPLDDSTVQQWHNLLTGLYEQSHAASQVRQEKDMFKWLRQRYATSAVNQLACNSAILVSSYIPMLLPLLLLSVQSGNVTKVTTPLDSVYTECFAVLILVLINRNRLTLVQCTCECSEIEWQCRRCEQWHCFIVLTSLDVV